MTATAGMWPVRPLKIGLLLLFLLVIVRLGWMADDAYISFRSVWNWVHGYGLTWNPVERVQAFSNPLWVLLIAAVFRITGELYLTAMTVSIVLTVLAVALVLARLARTLPQALAFVVVLLSAQAILDFSTSGLENPLSFLLAATFCVLWLPSTSGERPVFRLFLTGGLMALNRLDLIVLVAPALALVLLTDKGAGLWRRAALGLLPLLVWEAFSIVYYGFPFPNTYYAKLATGIPRSAYLEQGLLYLLDAAVRDPGLVMTVLIGAVIGGRGHARRPLALGVLLYVAYVVSAGGDFMQGRFLTAPAFVAAILLATAEPSTARPSLPAAAAFAQPWPLALAALVLLAAGTRLVGSEGGDPPIRANGVANERNFYVAHTGLIFHSRDRHVPFNHPWAQEGVRMRNAPGDHLFVFNTIGFIGYAAGPTVQIVDPLALADPFLARLPGEQPWRIGHVGRVIPDGYLASLRSGENRLTSPRLRELYDNLQLITRGPLFTEARWAAIWRMNAGIWRTPDAAR
ncbi:MAG TPA: hypothetical protein VFK72_02145 [Nevskia sp.]|nr:hypothetical protein [Nevskia sp.]